MALAQVLAQLLRAALEKFFAARNGQSESDCRLHLREISREQANIVDRLDSIERSLAVLLDRSSR